MRDNADLTRSSKQQRLIAAIVRERRKAFQREKGLDLLPEETMLFEEAYGSAGCGGDNEP